MQLATMNAQRRSLTVIVDCESGIEADLVQLKELERRAAVM